MKKLLILLIPVLFSCKTVKKANDTFIKNESAITVENEIKTFSAITNNDSIEIIEEIITETKTVSTDSLGNKIEIPLIVTKRKKTKVNKTVYKVDTVEKKDSVSTQQVQTIVKTKQKDVKKTFNNFLLYVVVTFIVITVVIGLKIMRNGVTKFI